MIRYLFLVPLLFFEQCQISEAHTISVNVIDDLKPVSFINEDGRAVAPISENGCYRYSGRGGSLNILTIYFLQLLATQLTLLNSDCEAKIWKNLNRVLGAKGRAKDLVKQILMFSRKSEVNRQPVQIELVVEEVVNLLKKTIPSTITIDLDVASNMVKILADRTQIHQFAMNLCTNAHHSMLEQGGRIDIC